MSLISRLKKAVKSVTKKVSSVVSKVASATEKAVSNVIKNPLPVIETVALTSVGVPPTLSSAVVTAANGGSLKNVGIAAATAFAGQEVGGVAGKAAAGATDSKLIGQIAASAAGASTQATLSGLAQGKGLQDSLSAGLKAGAVGGLTSGAMEGIKSLIPTDTSGTAPIEERSTVAATGEQAVDTGGQQFPTQPEVASSSTISPLGDNASSVLSGALKQGIYSGLFGSTPSLSQPTTVTKTAPPTPVTPTQTQLTYGPGSQALAQALRIGDAGAPVFGGDKEGGKKSGWNVESLRYMGNSEA